jgi:DNA primase catalytic subunit
MKNEKIFLYAKKQTLNRTLYKLHLQAANEWGRSWDISQNITQKIEKKMENKYKSIHNKTKKLTNKTQINKTKNAFPKRTENLIMSPSQKQKCSC